MTRRFAISGSTAAHPSRRQFLASGIAACVVPLLLRVPRAHARAADDVDPEPRAGIDASKVLTAEQLKSTPGAVAVFDQVRQIPQIIDGIRCHCGCAGTKGKYSLLSCYEGDDAMAVICPICQGQARMAFRLHGEGKSLAEIRAAIHARYD